MDDMIDMTDMTPGQLAGELIDIVENPLGLWQQSSWFFDSEFIEDDHKRLDIQYWLDELQNPTCGTTACVAGWAAIKVSPLGTLITASGVIYPDGRTASAANVGEVALGLSYEQAEYLFSGGRTKDEVVWVLESIRDDGWFNIPYPNEDAYYCSCGCMDEDED
jgi:hypothetical protein